MTDRLRQIVAAQPVPPRSRSLLAQIADPVDAVRASLPQYPSRYGAELTMPSRDVVQGERPLMPRFDGAPLVNPAENANTMAHANAVSGFAGGIGTRYVRRSQSVDTPFNEGAGGYAMFAETRQPRSMLESLSGYGPGRWISSGQGAVDVRELQPAMVRALREAGRHEELGTTAAQLARQANPSNIVDSAGLWDNPDLVGTVWERVLDPRGVTAVRTNDGLIIFDGQHARPIKAP